MKSLPSWVARRGCPRLCGNPPCGGISPNSPRAGRQQGSSELCGCAGGLLCPGRRRVSGLPGVGAVVRVPDVEAPLALYRRYRPETFAEVIGQEHVTTPLRAALDNNRVNHAYLFSGPRGCGKTTSARILARCLNCEQGPTDAPLRRPASRAATSPAAAPGPSTSSRSTPPATVASTTPATCGRRPSSRPSTAATRSTSSTRRTWSRRQGFNALLKLVEEPPEHLKFVFATTEPEKVIGTIRSRTHHYPFRLIPPRTLSDYLAAALRARRASRSTRPRCRSSCAPAAARRATPCPSSTSSSAGPGPRA